MSEAIALMQEGDDSLSLSVLAKRIGCSAPALYAHFANKDDLLEKVREQVFEDLVSDRMRTPGARVGSPADTLRSDGREFVAFARENPALYRLVFAPQHAVNGSQVQIDAAAVQPLAHGVRAAQDKGAAAGKPTETVAQAIWCAVHGAIMMALDRQFPGPEENRWARVEDALDTVIDMVLD
ncbi:TetR/AcrR family transcriptional regulator [Psychromarinibacter sp. C21-152]|uniref:TetR/AcrR family transcriptional regulator n=1 Tax=Psychromarinibacter sediminicola TaxID=3033385 RepID=A0AAE3TAI3_9RHOB|nr:TetR/AcrR family transcriptional regulator [Psychromarinibacter sediminicola]